MAAGSPLGWRPDREFLRRLRQEDPALELYWHPIRKRWVLYRVMYSGAGAADDTMLKEFTFETPAGGYIQPGPWLFDWLAKADKTARGSTDPGQADKQYLEAITKEPELEEEAEEKWRRPLSESLANDLAWCLNGRQSIVSNWEPTT